MKFLLTVFLAVVSYFANAYDYDVRKPKIKPDWSGAKVCTWTMDYESALDAAGTQGKYTLMLYSGMWWCPHCQHLEENVLVQSEWKKYVKKSGYYLTVLDFPYRNGVGNWCWLWDESYRKNARLTPTEVTEEIIRRYAVQDSYSVPGSIHQVATNVVVTTEGKGKNVQTVFSLYEDCPVTEYNRVGYPTIIVIGPDGVEVGRFNVNCLKNDRGEYNNPEYMANPIGYVKAKVNALTHADAAEKIVGNWSLAYSCSGQAGYGSLLIAVGKNGKVKVTGTDAQGNKVKQNSVIVTGPDFCSIPVSIEGRSIAVQIAEDGTATLSDDDAVRLVAFGSSGVSTGDLSLYGVFKDFPYVIDGKVLTDVTAVASSRFSAKGSKLISTCGVKISVTTKTGVFKGSFTVPVYNSGKIENVKVSVNGIFVNGVGYGTAAPKNGTCAGFLLDSTVPEDCDDDNGICLGDC